MKAVYKIKNNQDKVTTKHFYHIRCDTDLEEGLYAMLCITCACTRSVEQISNPWLTNLDKTLQPRYDIKTKICNHHSILSGYNKWYISKLT